LENDIIVLGMSIIPGEIAYLYRGRLSKAECDRIIRTSEETGVVDDTLDLSEYGFRKQRRLKYANYPLSSMIYDKVKDDFETDTRGRYMAEKTLITYVHYSPGSICPLHTDSKVSNGIGKEKYITVIVYLNNFHGGETYFISPNRHLDVSAGDILVFHGQKIPHGCNVVKTDKKIIIFGLEKL
jgi:hypothetical protein